MQKKDLNSKVIFEAIPGFDWQAHNSDNPGRLRENKKIKKHPGDDTRIYSNEPYAQELYEIYSGHNLNLTVPVAGEVRSGKVVSINNKYAMVDINWREDAMLDISKEESAYLKYIQKDFPIEVLIEKVGKTVGSRSSSIIVSYSKNILAKKKEEILSSVGEPIAYACQVKELIHGGYFVDVDGVRCFMPGSLGGMNKLVNFESLIGKNIYVVPINYSKEKDYIVVSHRDYLKNLIPTTIKQLQFGIEYEGFVTGCSRHGIFVEFNECLTGLISKKDISKEIIEKFEEGKVKAGESIKFYISEIIDNDKIVLSQYLPEPKIDAWDDIENRFKIPSVVTGRVKRVVRYGVFIEIEPKVVGLLHKSHLEENTEFEVGQEIEVKIVKIDKESKKVDFTM